MTSEDELSASFEHSCFFSSFLSFFFGIRDNKADTPFDKVTVSNDCSGKEARDPFIFLLFLHSNNKYAINNYGQGKFAHARHRQLEICGGF